MLSESLKQFILQPGDLAVDATLGAGGHAEQLLRAVAPGGRFLGLDVDPVALELSRQRLAPLSQKLDVRLDLLKANFRHVTAHVRATCPDQSPRAILADLGVSSMQFDCPDRGFSFRHDAPLDLRMDPALPRTGADLLRELSEEALADVLYHLGGERRSRRIARAIIQDRQRGRPIETTGQLEGLIRRVLKVRGRARIHPATRAFQALRMAVNEELEALTGFLDTAPELLAPSGTLAVITFHSGEDRLVKQAFKRWAATGRFQMMHKSVLRPGFEEVQRNPRSRSAKLRALRRTGDT
jgi:16S rRNA (cytosine1402-N4)-methyltransferase